MNTVIHGPFLEPGWGWGKKDSGYDIRVCQKCNAREAWIYNKWVPERSRPCLCLVDHNHLTRDIKQRGKCPGCDKYWRGRDARLLREGEVT